MLRRHPARSNEYTGNSANPSRHSMRFRSVLATLTAFAVSGCSGSPAEPNAPWGPPPSAIAVLRAVKAALDPQGRFGPGRFDPWM